MSNWQYSDPTNRVVFRPTENGGTESVLANDSAIVAWVATGNTILPAPALPPALQASNAITAGVAVTSTANGVALNGTYACDKATTDWMADETLSIAINGTFADGGATLAWPDTQGNLHTFASVTEFKAFATQLAAYVANVRKFATGQINSLPANTITIP